MTNTTEIVYYSLDARLPVLLEFTYVLKSLFMFPSFPLWSNQRPNPHGGESPSYFQESCRNLQVRRGNLQRRRQRRWRNFHLIAARRIRSSSSWYHHTSGLCWARTDELICGQHRVLKTNIQSSAYKTTNPTSRNEGRVTNTANQYWERGAQADTQARIKQRQLLPMESYGI